MKAISFLVVLLLGLAGAVGVAGAVDYPSEFFQVVSATTVNTSVNFGFGMCVAIKNDGPADIYFTLGSQVATTSSPTLKATDPPVSVCTTPGKGVGIRTVSSTATVRVYGWR